MSVTRIICPNGCGFPIAFCSCDDILDKLRKELKDGVYSKYENLPSNVRNREQLFKDAIAEIVKLRKL